MSDEINQRLLDLEWRIWRDLDELHDKLLAELAWMARSVGQSTRVDRLKVKRK